MVDSLLALTRRLHVDVRWWSPWNEVNNQSFGAPQRVAEPSG